MFSPRKLWIVVGEALGREFWSLISLLSTQQVHRNIFVRLPKLALKKICKFPAATPEGLELSQSRHVNGWLWQTRDRDCSSACGLFRVPPHFLYFGHILKTRSIPTILGMQAAIDSSALKRKFCHPQFCVGGSLWPRSYEGFNMLVKIQRWASHICDTRTPYIISNELYFVCILSFQIWPAILPTV